MSEQITTISNIIEERKDEINEELEQIKHTCFTKIVLFIKNIVNCNCESSSNCVKYKIFK